MNGQNWSEAEKSMIGTLRSNVTRPTAEQRRHLSARLARSIEARPSSDLIRSTRGSRSAAQRRILSAALSALGNPIALAAAFSVGGAAGAVVFTTIERARSPAAQVASAPTSRRPSLPPSLRPSGSVPGSPRGAPEPPSRADPLSFGQGSVPRELRELRELREDGVPTESPPPPKSSVRSRPLTESAALQPASSGSATLAVQRALLDTARVALARGDNAAALGAVSIHQQQYPNSVLSEEREALAIKALVGTGHHAEAEARAARFRSRYPNSIMLPAIDDMLGTIP